MNIANTSERNNVNIVSNDSSCTCYENPNTFSWYFSKSFFYFL